MHSVVFLALTAVIYLRPAFCVGRPVIPEAPGHPPPLGWPVRGPVVPLGPKTPFSTTPRQGLGINTCKYREDRVSEILSNSEISRCWYWQLQILS